MQVRACPVLLAWAVPCFSLGAWSLGRAASSVAFHPSPSLGSVRLVVLGSVSTSLEMAFLFFHGIVVAHFLGISRSVFGCVCFLLFLELLASSCPGSAGREGGSAGLGLHPPASVPPDPATRLSGWPHWVTIPPKLQSAFYSAGKYSVGTNGVLRKIKHIFPNTYQRINMMARLPHC